MYLKRGEYQLTNGIPKGVRPEGFLQLEGEVGVGSLSQFTVPVGATNTTMIGIRVGARVS
jgi:hypothetical protein